MEESAGGFEGGGVIDVVDGTGGAGGSGGGASGTSLLMDAVDERCEAGVRVISPSYTGCVEATYATDAHLEFMAVAPSLPLAMPRRPHRRWI